MTQGNKELLTQDLCARLLHEVKIHAKYFDTDTNTEVEKVGVLSMIDNDTVVAFTCDDTNCYNYVTIHEVKPYLFPLSSMTEEQKEEYCQLQQKIIYNSKGVVNKDITEYIKWCYKNHLDINGLIPLGLANDATNLNIY